MWQSQPVESSGRFGFADGDMEAGRTADLGRFSQISDAIQVRLFSTPLSRALTTGPTDLAQTATENMQTRQFSQAPVVSGRNVVGLFTADSEAGGRVGDIMRPIDKDLLISGDTSVGVLAQFLADEPFLFLLTGRSITGFVTAADMTRPEPRTYFYLLLADLEVVLADFTRLRFPDQAEALRLLTDERREKAEGVLIHLRREDAVVDAVAALQLADLLKIAGPDLRRAGALNNRTWRSLSNVIDFRNDVMHPVRDYINESPSGMQKLAQQASRVQQLTALTLKAMEAITNR